MPERLVFTDAAGAGDLLVFAGRAAGLGDGVVRLRAQGGVLLASCAPIAPRTLLDPTPTVIGMRVGRVDPELECDLTVPAAALTAGEEPAQLLLPETGVTAPWAGISPPRSGWAGDGALPAAAIAAAAQRGIAEVARRLPAEPGEDVVHGVRAAVWAAPDPALAQLPAGAAFAAFALGFLRGDEDGLVRTHGAWTRLSLPRGHVLVRDRSRGGLTPVRATGRAG